MKKKLIDTRRTRKALLQVIADELFYKRGSIPQIYGKVKTGKTDFACMLANQAVGLGIFERVATNIEGTPNEWAFIEDTYELWEWMKEGRKTKTPGIFLFDEADGAISPMRHGSHINELVGKILWQAGKCYTQTVPITHRSKDLDTRVKWLKHTLIIKKSKRRFSWETDLKSLRDLKNFLIRGGRWPLTVPQTVIPFDPDAIATLKYKPHPDFEDEEEEENKRDDYIRRLYESSTLTQKEIGDIFELSPGRIGQIVREENGL